MIHSGRVEMSKSIGTVITKITLSVNVKTVPWISVSRSSWALKRCTSPVT